MSTGSRGFLCILLALIPAGYWLGRTLARAGQGESPAEQARPGGKRIADLIAAPSGPAKAPPSKSSAPIPKPARDEMPVWDPWQDGKEISLPLSFFRNFTCRVLESGKRLNEEVLKAIGIAGEHLPEVQSAWSASNDRNVAADLKHRKVLRNDGDTVEIEVPAYPEEAKTIRDEFNARIKAVIGAEKTELLDLMISSEASMKENRGIHRRVYTFAPADDGCVRVEEKSYRNAVENSGTEYIIKTDVPGHLQHLFKIEAGEATPVSDR